MHSRSRELARVCGIFVAASKEWFLSRSWALMAAASVESWSTQQNGGWLAD
jgi:hypothetical protein